MKQAMGWLEGFSFKEKSVLISLLAVLVVYGAYFFNLVSGQGDATLQAMLHEMIGIVVALVFIHIVFYSVISLDDQPEEDDERDRAVARRAAMFGYNVLFVVVLLTYLRVLITGAWSEEDPDVTVSLFETANLLLAGLVGSEAVYYAAQLFFYRRGL